MPASIDIGGETSVVFRVQSSADKSSPGLVVYGEPYKLMAFVNYQKVQKSYVLRKMTLLGANGVSLALPDKNRDLRSDDQRPSEGTNVMEYEIRKLEYQPYKLSGELVLETSAKHTSYPIEVLLDTDYKEERLNLFWEGLMGI